MTGTIRSMANADLWLVRFARAAQGQPFEWGRTDCATLARRALTTILGRDPWEGEVGEWTTQTGALRVFKRTDPEIALRASGAVEVGRYFATSGDVALGPQSDSMGLPAIYVLVPIRKVLTSNPDKGVIIASADELDPDTRFWRYGR